MLKIGQSGGYLGRLLWPLVKVALSLMKNVLKPLVESVLIPLRLTAVASVTGATIQKKVFGSGLSTMIISNEEINYIMKVVKSLEDVGLLIKSVSETIENETNIIGKGVKLWKITGQGVMRAGEGPGEGFLMWFRALSNLEIQKYY